MSFRRSLRVVFVLGLFHGLAAPAGAQKFTISGYDTLTFRADSVKGSSAGQQAYTYGNYERQRNIENNAGLNITGYLLPRIVLNATLNASRYSPDRSRYNLEYKGKGLNMMIGDINVALTGNEFTPMNKSLRGIKVDAQAGPVKLSTLLSQQRAQVATDVFQGNNSAGPYTLRYSPIVDGSEQVRKDGQKQKLGTDYTIDYNTGMLWFRDGTIVPETSTIEVSYEYAAYGATPGILAGMRGEFSLFKFAQMGLTYITQMNDLKSGSDNSYRTDLFIGDPLTTVYQVRYRPVKRIVKVTLDGIAQVEGTDYLVKSLDAGTIEFRKTVPAPPGAAVDAAPNLVIEYEIATTTTSADMRGDRKIYGIDGTFKLAEKSSIALQFARSAGTPARTGNAISLRGNTELGRVTLGLGFRNVDSRFSAIESVGFSRKERSIEGNLEYRATEHLRFTGRASSSSSPSSGGYYSGYGSYYGGSTYTNNYTTTGLSATAATAAGRADETDTTDDTTDDTTTTTTETTLRTVTSSVGVVLDYPKLPSLDLQHQRYHTKGGSANNSSAMTSMNLRYSLGSAVQLTANMEKSDNESESTAGASASSFTQRYSVAYTPGSRFSLQTDFTTSSIRSRSAASTTTTTTTQTAATETNNQASSASVSMTWSPIQIATLTASYRISDSGSGGYSGYSGYSGYGNSYYSSAYTSGSYMNSSNYGFGNQYTGSYTTPNYSSSTSGSSSLFNSGTGSYLNGGIRSLAEYYARRAAASREDTTTDTTTDTDTTDDSTDTTTSTRIKSINRTIGLQLNPIDRLSLTANYSNDRQEGQLTGSDSISTNLGFGFSYTPWEMLTLDGQTANQNYTFLGQGGNSKSSIASLGARVGPFHRFSLRLNYQTMTSNTGMGSLSNYGYNTGTTTTTTTTTTDTGTTAGTSSSYQTQLDSITSRLEYPISQSRTLFTELQTSWTQGGGSYGSTTNPEDSVRLSAALGIVFQLNKFVNWQMDVSRINYQDRNNPQRNYSGNQLTGKVEARF